VGTNSGFNEDGLRRRSAYEKRARVRQKFRSIETKEIAKKDRVEAIGRDSVGL
jgi:hypothetical protein